MWVRVVISLLGRTSAVSLTPGTRARFLFLQDGNACGSSDGAGGAGVTGGLLEPFHAEFPDWATAIWTPSIKNNGGGSFFPSFLLLLGRFDFQ